MTSFFIDCKPNNWYNNFKRFLFMRGFKNGKGNQSCIIRKKCKNL